MSTADDAWNDWLRNRPIAPSQREVADHFYRRALEDAADALQVIADGIPRTETDSNAYARMCAYDNAAKTCRDRAAGVGTKDGDDDADWPFTKERPRHLWEGNFTPPESQEMAEDRKAHEWNPER